MLIEILDIVHIPLSSQILKYIGHTLKMQVNADGSYGNE